ARPVGFPETPPLFHIAIFRGTFCSSRSGPIRTRRASIGIGPARVKKCFGPSLRTHIFCLRSTSKPKRSFTVLSATTFRAWPPSRTNTIQRISFESITTSDRSWHRQAGSHKNGSPCSSFSVRFDVGDEPGCEQRFEVVAFLLA